VEARTFGSRLEAARYLDGKFHDSGLRDIEHDDRLWGWLTLFYFDELCPSDAHGRRKPLRPYHYLPVNSDYRLYYRHLLAGPYRIYRTHRDNPLRALVFLLGPLHVVGHFVYQLASRQELVTNPAVVEAATRLYVDRERSRYKRGAVSEKTRGSVFRYVKILDQLDVTWDLYSMTAERILGCLPDEFSRFMPEPAEGESSSGPEVATAT
jgi:hypothetical protein